MLDFQGECHGRGRALASTVFGAVSRSTTSNQPPPRQDYAQQQQYQQQQMQAKTDQMYQDRMRRTADYNQAFGACMKARNYSVN